MAQQRRKVRRGQQPARQQVTRGPLHAVPCPHCGRKQDFRSLADSSQGGVGWGGMMESGAKVDCDKCGRTAVIHTIAQVTVVKLKKA